MLVTNNDKVGKWFLYKVNGQTKRENIPGMTSVELPDLISLTQVIRNGYDVKVAHINSFLSRGILGDFSVIGSAGGVSVLQDWYDSLAVKPSEGLWTDLKIMADGMNSDGDWSEMDLFGMVAAMETDEQRLRPLKTTSGDDCTVEGSPGLSVNGVDNPSLTITNGLNLKWNPTDNGVKYTLTSAYIGAFGITKNSTIASSYIYGSDYNGEIIIDADSVLSISSISNGMRIASSSSVNNLIVTTTTTKTGLLNTVKTFYAGLKNNTTNTIAYINSANSSQSNITPDINLPSIDFGFLGIYVQDNPLTFLGNSSDLFYGRGYIAGSGLIDHNRVAARLNTFFSARGLSIDNY